MSAGLIKMWISFVAIILFFIAVVFIIASRNKLTGFWKTLTAIIAYLCLIIAAILVIFIIGSGAPGQ